MPCRFAHRDEAVTALMGIAAPGGRPVVAVLDEFPFLAKASPELPSLLRRALGPQARREVGPVRLSLCGFALSFMGGLLSGNASLRGRASLELVVPSLDCRLAAAFRGIADPRLALLVNAVVGGTPAYGREFTPGDTPKDADDFGPWGVRNVLNPGRPLFREARFLLAEEPDLHDAALYHGVLAAIAQGNHTRGGIAGHPARRSTDLGHALTVLEGTGMIVREPDAFHGKRSAYRIAEPILTFHHALMRPEWSDLERPGQAAEVWRRSQATFRGKVVGPHVEQVCRSWTRWHAGVDTLGGRRTRVESGVVSDPAAKTRHELDVVVFGRDGEEDGSARLLAIGEAKWNDVVGMGHLRRLERIRDLLGAREGVEAGRTRLLCFSGAGFTDELRAVAERDPGVQLVDLERLYGGS